jgi:hypothetical protein
MNQRTQAHERPLERYLEQYADGLQEDHSGWEGAQPFLHRISKRAILPQALVVSRPADYRRI